ncbi:MAG TPA: glucosaminidase domain-containing protein [Acidimicrobiia bacterium]|nr:glucosaminidase domain-containing protein [Acidimicrobiia bacterium]
MHPRWSARWLVALLVGVIAVGLAGAPGWAQTDPGVAVALTNLQQAPAAAHAAADQVQATTQQQAAVQAKIAANQARIAQLEAQIPIIRAQEAQLRKVLQQRAAAIYVSSGPLGHYESVLPDPTLTYVRRKVLANAAAKRDHQNADQLAALQVQLAQSESELKTEQTSLAQQSAQLDQLAAQLQSQQALMNQRVSDANAALERAKELGALRASGREPIQGPAVLTAAQMAGWIRSRGYSPHIQTTIDDLAQIYIQEGNDEGVRGDFAFAQAVIETGGFESAPANNYAGMGWCDSCSNGRGFPTPRDGVRAQIQHLLNYADSTSRAAKLHHPPSPFWYGSDPATAAQNFDTFFAKGWAPTWSDMGHGNWATDPNYSGKVIKVFNDMVAFAQGGGG